MLYPIEAIEQTTHWINTDDSIAEQWLTDNNYNELVQLKQALRRYPKAFEYLLVHKHVLLAAFVNAVWNDDKAFKLLMDKKAFVWAAMANFINGDEKAALFLNKNKLSNYLQLASAIQERIRKDGDESTSMFNSGPYKNQ